MAHQKVRGFCALLLAVMLVVAGAVQRVQASDMAITMTAVASGLPTPSDCGGCTDNDHGMSATACLAHCGSVVAILPFVTPIDIAILISPPAIPVIAIAGHQGPPDPYPPKPIILT